MAWIQVLDGRFSQLRHVWGQFSGNGAIASFHLPREKFTSISTHIAHLAVVRDCP